MLAEEAMGKCAKSTSDGSPRVQTADVGCLMDQVLKTADVEQAVSGFCASTQQLSPKPQLGFSTLKIIKCSKLSK